MSPIAAATIRALDGIAVKGSGRKLNAAQRPPSVAQLLAAAPTFEDLAELRRRIFVVHQNGLLAATPKTLRTWEERLWVRVIELMRAEPTRAPFIFNATLRWTKPVGLQQALDREMQRLVAPLTAEAKP